MNFYRYTFYALACTSIVMLIIAIVSPFWIVQHFEEDDFHMGLWSICFGTVICSYISVVTANLAAVQGLMLVALACCFLALICSQDLLTRCLKKKVPENLISSAAFYHAGFCILFSLIIMYLRLRAIMMEVEVLHLSPDWAFFMSMFTCSFCLVLGSCKTSRMSFFRKAYCAMCSINTVLLIISIASPFWLVHHCVPGDIHVGLWMVCFQKDCIRNPVSIGSVTVTQGLMITALGSSFIALLASQDLFTRVLKRKVPEVLISSLANYSAGLCTICSLMIMLFELQVVVKTENFHLAPDWAFWVSCVSFLLSLVLGTRSLLFHQCLLIEEKMMASQVNPLQVPQPLLFNNMKTPV